MPRMAYVLAVFCAAASFFAAAQVPRIMVASGPPFGYPALWILGSDGRLSAYDVTDLHLIFSGAPLPPAARQYPQNLAISTAGLVLYTGPDGQPHLWNLRFAAEQLLPGTAPASLPTPGPNGNLVQIANAPQLGFGANGQHLFWFQNRMRVLQREGRGDVSRTGEFVAWTTTTDGLSPRPLIQIVLPECACGTGACEETCPQIAPWTPRSGVASFFFLTRFIVGQLSSDELETDLYQAAGNGWRRTRLSVPESQILDARDNGATYIGTVPDAACCGWENESTDQAYLVHAGHRTTFFDEQARFGNADYDVSFFTANARFSPAGSSIAYTIQATSKADQPIRLADQGKANPAELTRIRAALTQLPQVEVAATGDPARPRIALPHAQLIGWLNEHTLLIWQGGEVFRADAVTGHLNPTGLHAPAAANVILP